MDEVKNIKDWTPKQRLFLEWLTQPTWGREPVSQGLFAQEVGVAEETLSRWKKLEGFEDELFQMIKARIGDALPDVMGAFKAEAKKGEFQHIKMYLEMLGMYTPKSEVSGEVTHTVKVIRNVSMDDL